MTPAHCRRIPWRLPVVVLACSLAAAACDRASAPAVSATAAPSADLLVTFQEYQCYGSNELRPEQAVAALKARGIDARVGEVLKPASVPNCEACYPSCSLSFSFHLLVPAAQKEAAERVLSEAERKAPASR
jgi:hypothetical protein